MPWFKVDDKFHDHRKSRRAGAAAIGLWTLAGSWSADNLTDGFVPDAVLPRWGSETFNVWEEAGELVAADLWHRAEVDGEVGFQFHEWEHYQPTREDVEAQRESARERMARVRANRKGTSPEVRTTPSRPVPSRPNGANAPLESIDRFPEFWDTYDKKVGRKAAEAKWRIALRKPGVTAESLIAAAAAYITWQRSQGSHPQYTKNAATWLHGECWNDERTVPAPASPPASRAAQWLRLAQESQQETHPEIGEPS